MDATPPAVDRARSLDNARYLRPVPVISTFFGITIRMFYREHGMPHFHADHQGQQATFTFNGKVLVGGLSPTAQRLIREWTLAHRAELEANWNRLKTGEPLERIAPLE